MHEAIDTTPGNRRKTGLRRRRNLLILSSLLVTLLTLALAITFKLIAPGFSRHSLYNPERDSLVEAQWQFAHAALPDDPVDQDAWMNRHIRRVLAALKKAQAEHPESHTSILRIRDMLVRLQAADRRAEQRADERRALYRKISDKLDTLVDRTPHRPPASLRT